MEAIHFIKEIVAKEKIKCHLEETKAIIFTKEDKGISKIQKEKEFLEENGISCKDIYSLPILFPIQYGIEVNGNYTFNPVKYLKGLKKKYRK